MRSQWRPASVVTGPLRAVKDDGEVKQIREAIAIAERAYGMFRAMIEPDATERASG